MVTPGGISWSTELNPSISLSTALVTVCSSGWLGGNRGLRRAAALSLPHQPCPHRGGGWPRRQTLAGDVDCSLNAFLLFFEHKILGV